MPMYPSHESASLGHGMGNAPAPFARLGEGEAGGAVVATDEAVGPDRRGHGEGRAPALLGMSAGTPAQWLEAVLAAMADAVIVYDAEGRIVASNGALADVLGFSTESAYAKLPIEERGRQSAPRTPEGRPFKLEETPAWRILSGEELRGARAVDMLVTNPDGREVALNAAGGPLRDDAGRITGAVVVLRDVTERRRLEMELAARAAELETIFTTQAEAVVLADASGRIIRMNEAQSKLLALAGSDPAAEHIDAWSRRIPSRDAQGQPIPFERLPFYRALRGETITGDQAMELYKPQRDGRDMVLRVSAAPVRDAQGHILGAVLTTSDVTRQRLLEQQRLAIMRTVVHDLSNPVAATRLYLQTQQRRLAQGLSPFVPGDALLQQMDDGLTRMQRLLDDLRVATKVELGTLDLQRARHDLGALCRTEAEAQQMVTGRVVRLEAPAQPVWVEIDKQRIGQVFANLLTNAIKYSPADRPVTVTLEAAAGHARVAVRDEGPGISEQEQRRLFEQFHRVEGIKAQDGSGSLGLGLYISKAIITQHKGDIGVESAVGAGSTFWFSLPLAGPQDA